MPTCPEHGCELICAITPIRYGYPDMEVWDLEVANPYHGEFTLGGCVITPESPSTRRSWYCPVCAENVKTRITPTHG